MKKLNSDEIILKLSGLRDWTQNGDSIEKEFTHKDFGSALAFTVKVGIEAEKLDHHPDIFIHSWNKVKIMLSTHSANGITENDFQLAKKIEEL